MIAAVKRLLLLLLLAAPAAEASGQKLMHPLASAQKEELAHYLMAHWQSPEEYIVGKFADYDLVFLGKFSQTKQNVLLVQRLIPRLYKAGVYNLGIEFGVTECQNQVDRLITARKYDEALARRIMFQSDVELGYKEYMDLYRAAWKLNRSLAPGAKKFRVVNLNYHANWSALSGERTGQKMAKVWVKGDPDVYMAQTILREFVEKGQKALILSGVHHSFTHYHQPVYNFRTKQFIRFEQHRMGNVVYDKVPAKVFNVVLHFPWQSKEEVGSLDYPVGGAIDQVMAEFNNEPVGFDVKGSPFGKLTDSNSYYSAGYDDFVLQDFCDGYIYQNRLSDYESVTVDPKFVTKKNLKEAIANLPDPEYRETLTSPEAFLRFMKKLADVKGTLRGFN